jgi:hypothetical protein
VNRHDRRAAKARGDGGNYVDPSGFVRDERGERLQVIRPSNPELALKLAKTAVDNNDTALLDRLPGIVEDAAGQYTFMGYLGRRASGQPCLFDDDGKDIGETVAGDSFVTGLDGVKP